MKYFALPIVSLFLAACTTGTAPDGNDNSSEAAYNWTANEITRNDEVIISASDIPDSIRVSEDASFGAAGDFSSFQASSNGRWLAFSTAGAAHDAGWIYDTQNEELRPVVFQYGGSVEVVEWEDDTHVVFKKVTPQPAEEMMAIDAQSPPAYPRLMDEVSIEQRYEGKIVYTSQQVSQEEMQAYRNDCSSRGGTFDECGNTCAPDADVCTEVCALTCIFDESDNGGADAGWETYRSEDIGISVHYPEAMQVEEGAEGPADAGVEFMLLGSTQTRDTEIFDGISVTIQRGTHQGTLQSYVEEQIEQARTLGTITDPLSTVRLAGRQAFTYTADTLGVYTNYYLSVGAQEYLRIGTLSPDPTNKGYDQTVQRMLESLEIL